ncbi:UNVERIFIED_CONTAM: hypothetical protein K2H54_017430 [Gekko kuhli]
MCSTQYNNSSNGLQTPERSQATWGGVLGCILALRSPRTGQVHIVAPTKGHVQKCLHSGYQSFWGAAYEHSEWKSHLGFSTQGPFVTDTIQTDFVLGYLPPSINCHAEKSLPE